MGSWGWAAADSVTLRDMGKKRVAMRYVTLLTKTVTASPSNQEVPTGVCRDRMLVYVYMPELLVEKI